MLSRAPTRTVRDWFSDSRHWDDYRPREGDIVHYRRRLEAELPADLIDWLDHGRSRA